MCAVEGRQQLWPGWRAEKAQSVLRNLSPVQDSPRDWWIDGDPKGLRICFHSECSPSGWLEKTLSTDRSDTERKSVCRVCACVCTCADSVSVLILKATPFSGSRSVKWGYTHSKNPKIHPVSMCADDCSLVMFCYQGWPLLSSYFTALSPISQ